MKFNDFKISDLLGIKYIQKQTNTLCFYLTTANFRHLIAKGIIAWAESKVMTDLFIALTQEFLMFNETKFKHKYCGGIITAPIICKVRLWISNHSSISNKGFSYSKLFATEFGQLQYHITINQDWELNYRVYFFLSNSWLFTASLLSQKIVESASRSLALIRRIWKSKKKNK